MDQHIGVPRQAEQDVARGGGLQVQHKAALAAVDRGEVGALPVRPERRPEAVFIAARAFPLDHVGAEIGQQLGTVGTGQNAAEIDHPDAIQDFHLAVSSVCAQTLPQRQAWEKSG
jgi:hypothetical protein